VKQDAFKLKEKNSDLGMRCFTRTISIPSTNHYWFSNGSFCLFL